MASDVRLGVTLACEECRRRNYQTNKSRRNTPDLLELRKYCHLCGRHTPHKETSGARAGVAGAKTRAQRKAERRARDERAAREARRARGADSRAQERTKVPESAEVVEAELAEQGADLDALTGPAPAETVEDLAAPAPSRADVPAPAEAAPDRIGRREKRRAEKDRQRRRKESEKRRQAAAEPQGRQRGAVI